MTYTQKHHAMRSSGSPGKPACELAFIGFPGRRARAAGIGTLSAGWFRPMLKRVLEMECIHTGFWTVRLLASADMADLHLRMLNIPGPTDVLTFDYCGGEAACGRIELDTAVCLDVAQREAAERGHWVGHELLLYMVHSLLHVRGYNDMDVPQARCMHRREDEILTELLSVPVYHRITAAGGAHRGASGRRGA